MNTEHCRKWIVDNAKKYRIMNDVLQECSRQVVDGQELCFCSPEKWYELLKQGEVNGVPIPDYYKKRIQKLELPLAIKYPDFQLALMIRRVGDRSGFMFYTLAEIRGHYQRVGVAGAKCEHCEWSGWIGNPNVSDIYFGISKEFKAHELMRKARIFERKPCPSCGSKLNQAAIWIGEFP